MVRDHKEEVRLAKVSENKQIVRQEKSREDVVRKGRRRLCFEEEQVVSCGSGRDSKNRDVSNEHDNVEAIDELDTNGGNSFFKVVFGSNKAV